MPKSMGEFLTVSLLEEKGYNPLAYRLFFLQSHYRQNLVFSWENLDNAAGTYNKLVNRVATLKPDETKQPNDEAAKPYQEKFLKALTNDLNTSLAITSVYDVLKARDLDNVTKLYLLEDFDRVLSLDLVAAAAKLRADQAAAKAKAAGTGEYTITGPADATEEEAAKVNALLTARYEARKAKNWAESDRIRDELAAMGVVVKDSKDGAVWSRA